MALGGAVHQPRLAGVAVHPFQQGVLGIALGAAKLDRRVDGQVQGVGDGDLGHGDFLAGEIALIQFPAIFTIGTALPDRREIAGGTIGALPRTACHCQRSIATRPYVVRLPLHRLCGVLTPLKPVARNNGFRHEHDGFVMCKIAKRGPLPLVLRRSCKGEFGGDNS